jgi:hypothetical protein
MPRPLRELRPCDACGGPLSGGIFTAGGPFHVIRTSIAVVNPDAVNEYIGMTQFFGGRASQALVENFAPAAARGFTIAMDEAESTALGVEIFLCTACYQRPIDLLQLVETVGARSAQTEKGTA